MRRVSRDVTSCLINRRIHHWIHALLPREKRDNFERIIFRIDLGWNSFHRICGLIFLEFIFSNLKLSLKRNHLIATIPTYLFLQINPIILISMIVVRIIGERGFYKFVWIIQLQFHHQFSLGFGHVFALWFWKIFRKVFRTKEKKKKKRGIKAKLLTTLNEIFLLRHSIFQTCCATGEGGGCKLVTRNLHFCFPIFPSLSLSKNILNTPSF